MYNYTVLYYIYIYIHHSTDPESNQPAVHTVLHMSQRTSIQTDPSQTSHRVGTFHVHGEHTRLLACETAATEGARTIVTIEYCYIYIYAILLLYLQNI